AYASLVDRWDAADPGEGYTCFGGPSGRDARIIPIQLLGGWTPGSLGGDFPAGNGVLVRPGSRIVVQVHYNLDHTRPKPDRTALELQRAARLLPGEADRLRSGRPARARMPVRQHDSARRPLGRALLRRDVRREPLHRRAEALAPPGLEHALDLAVGVALRDLA